MRYEPGDRVRHFRIIESIGAGGMGEVFLADDEKLKREVALKFPAPDLIQDPTVRARFAREAEALAGLRHPAIPTIFEFQNEPGAEFICMEFVHGETLDKRLERGVLRERELLDLAIQLAEGLAAAHGAGVLHRDLKPANLMLTPEGRLKILDFGLARPIRRDAESGLTAQDVVPGTVAYLAPELLIGGEPSERTDLYAVGLVLYEGATGSLPFPGLKGPALWDAITRATVEPAQSRNPRLSRELSDLIGRLLEKKPEKRPESAVALAAALRSLLPAGSAGRPPRGALVAAGLAVAIVAGVLAWRGLVPTQVTAAPTSWAVLPMNCDSTDPEIAFYSEGVAVGLVGELSSLPALRVTSWESSRGFCPERTSISAIAGSLRVQRLVTGDVQISRGRVRILTRIVDPIADRALWSQSFSGDTGNIPALQARVQRELLREIRRQVPSAAPGPETNRTTTNPEAYRAYQRARYYWERRPGELALAIEYFERAIAADSTYAAAFAGAADAWAAVGLYGLKPPVETRVRALAAARRAVALDDASSEAHTALAHILHNYEWDWQGAETEYQRALELNPSNATAHHDYAHLLAQRGRIAEARTEIHAALELNPNSITSSIAAGVVEYYARDNEAALAALRDAAELDSTSVLLHRLRAAVLDRCGRESEAVAMLARAADLQHQPALAEGLRRSFAAGGIAPALQILIGALRAKRAAGAYEPAEHVAELYARLGNVKEALDWLETAYRERDTELNRLGVDPLFDPLRKDPRFARLSLLVGFTEPTP